MCVGRRRIKSCSRLCNARFTTVDAEIDLGNISTTESTGDLNKRMLSVAMRDPSMNETVVTSWKKKAGTCSSSYQLLFCLKILFLSPLAGRRSTLVFCVDVAHVLALTEAFNAAGVDAACVHAKTPSAQREKLLTSFKAGEYPVLLNCGEPFLHQP